MCGDVAASAHGGFTPVAPGRYWTAINIHNPDTCRAATFRWKVAIALPGQPGPVPVFQKTIALDPDRALEIDNPQILSVLAPPLNGFLKGYVVLESDIELDVVAVYSGATGACAANVFATERVPSRRVALCEDLLLTLDTGLAGWQTVSPTAGPAQIVTGAMPATWAAPPFGSVWISERASDGAGSPAPVMTRSYELCFCLCFGFDVPAPFQIALIADNEATVYLNNVLIGGAGFGSWHGPPTLLTVDPALTPFVAGRNCFRVDVPNPPVNTANPTGFALSGLVRIRGGKCPCCPPPLT